MKARSIRRPTLRLGVVPRLLAVTQRERPVEKVAEVREDLTRSLRRVANLERRKTLRRAAHRLAAAIRERRDGVTKQSAFRVDRVGDHEPCILAVKIEGKDNSTRRPFFGTRTYRAPSHRTQAS